MPFDEQHQETSLLLRKINQPEYCEEVEAVVVEQQQIRNPQNNLFLHHWLKRSLILFPKVMLKKLPPFTYFFFLFLKNSSNNHWIFNFWWFFFLFILISILMHLFFSVTWNQRTEERNKSRSGKLCFERWHWSGWQWRKRRTYCNY